MSGKASNEYVAPVVPTKAEPAPEIHRQKLADVQPVETPVAAETPAAETPATQE